MISPVTRRLLRDWKRLWHQQNTRYHIRPQDSNLHLWNFALTSKEAEIYGVFFIGGSDTEPIIVMRGFTPNHCFPANKNVNLTHLAPILLTQGLSGFLDQLYRMLDHTSTVGGIRFMQTWNRLMIKDFKAHFPELHASFSPEPQDYALVQQSINSTAKHDHPLQSGFKFRDLSPLSDTIACDNDDKGKDTKRRKLDVSGTAATEGERESDSDTELHRKRRA
ncbi:LADA_0D03356g1_1 [Lachancea dasiensis]|uniref:LADA_0D03356g1_1 n=1 Tax=Lachancea dasiensis TaxID=1072105 RepID=A0A1G4J4Z2_9SACH|nr:LADA_0D03356g1_1 [Lachancea dasiensis]